ncbi:MAG TPA: NAD(P)H-binding protein, partial [Gemmatimonadales bacterium]|nr:NAD(P)H-binding protein [Gemmatimonadales bacterium]
MRVLVTGATGYIGGRLVPRLLAAGHQVVCLARVPDKLAGRRWEGVEVRQGDVLDPATLEPALRGVAVAYYLIHSMAEGTGSFEQRDRRAAQHF